MPPLVEEDPARFPDSALVGDPPRRGLVDGGVTPHRGRGCGVVHEQGREEEVPLAAGDPGGLAHHVETR